MLQAVDLISPAYLAEQRILHAAPQGYGGKAAKWAPTVLAVATQYNAASILDYGCGQGTLARALLGLEPRLSVREYDPAISEKNRRPAFADLVTCTDVLEHVEPAKLPTVLRHLHALARKAVFLVVALAPSNKTLSDGRNAHLILQPAAWWEAQVCAAGLTVQSVEGLPFHPKYQPDVQQAKRWIMVVTP